MTLQYQMTETHECNCQSDTTVPSAFRQYERWVCSGSVGKGPSWLTLVFRAGLVLCITDTFAKMRMQAIGCKGGFQKHGG